jgi:predicted TIM-barrel fold metal-dependent hydrolase
MQRIDIHTHFHCLDFVKHLQGRSALPRTVLEGGTYIIQCASSLSVPCLPKLVDMEEKLREMEQMHIDVAVLSHGLPLGPDILDAQEADEWAMRINDDLARIIQAYPGKFIGLGSIGFGDVQRSLAEVDRCINILGLKGFQIFSNIGHKMLNAPDFLPVFKHIATLGVPVHLHPAIPLNTIGMDSASLYIGLGFPYDSSLNVLQLILSGFFDEAPDFKMIVAHVGGIIPYLKGRLETYSAPSPLITAAPKLLHPPGHYLTNLYVDTVCYHLEALNCCYKVMGAGHLLYGTDHPFGDYRKAAEIIEQLDCSEPERELIYHRNAEQLFRRSNV